MPLSLSSPYPYIEAEKRTRMEREAEARIAEALSHLQVEWMPDRAKYAWKLAFYMLVQRLRLRGN
jgi:hypothetical protein